MVSGGCNITLGKVSHADRKVALTGTTALHEAIEIKCFYEGSATLIVDSKTLTVNAGDVVVINPYEFHATLDAGEKKGAYHLFMLPLDYLSGVSDLNLHKLYFTEGKKFPNLFVSDTRLYSLLMEAAEEARQARPAGELMIKSLIMAFFAQLLRKGVVDAGTSVPDKSSLRIYSVIEPALRCIKNEYQRSLTVDELAQLCKVSKHYFCRVFKTVTQKSAMEYLRDFRLQVANALLSNMDNSIAEVAACCGFESPNYFSRCYKQYYGKTPRQGRNAKEEAL